MFPLDAGPFVSYHFAYALLSTSWLPFSSTISAEDSWDLHPRTAATLRIIQNERYSIDLEY
jgi:hypothetical protein